jgi:hypothetical protein
MNWAPTTTALEIWEYSAKSSWGFRAVAALKHFGLMEEEGTSDDRKVKLTELARKIIRDKRPNSSERRAAIQEAALKPKIYGEVWREWETREELPNQAQMEYELEHKWSFNPSAIEGFIRDFRSTLRFANLWNEDILAEEDTDRGENGGADMPPRPPAGPRRAQLATSSSGGGTGRWTSELSSLISQFRFLVAERRFFQRHDR